MPLTNIQLTKTILSIGTITSWFAIVSQLYVTLATTQLNLVNTLIKFFSYFTILTNVLVAIYFTIRWIRPNSTLGKFFSKFSTTTAVTVYIMVVGITYNLVLRNLFKHTGWAKIADEMLHAVIPLLFMLFWLFIVQKEKLQWKQVVPWLGYPFSYLVFTLIRGEYVNSYPYPFVDVLKIGYQQVIINCLAIGIFSYLLSVLLVGISRRIVHGR